jgi:hypothetical protein
MDWLASLAQRGRLLRFALLLRADQSMTIDLARSEGPKAARPLEFGVFTEESQAVSWLEA